MLFKAISKLKKSASCPNNSSANSLQNSNDPFDEPAEKTDTPSFKINLPTSRCVPHSMRALNLSSLVIEPYHIYTPTEPTTPAKISSASPTTSSSLSNTESHAQHPCNRWLSRKLSKARSKLVTDSVQEPPAKNLVSDRYLAKLENVQYRLKRLIQPHKIIYEIEYNRDGRWLQLEPKTSADLDAVHKKGFSKMDVRFDKNLMQHNLFEERTLKHKDSFDVQVEIWYMQSTDNPDTSDSGDGDCGGLRTRRVRWWKTTDRGMAYLPGTHHDTSSLPMTRNHVLGFFKSLQENNNNNNSNINNTNSSSSNSSNINININSTINNNSSNYDTLSIPPSLVDTDGTASTQDFSFDGQMSPRISWTD
ncbi:hypothetical protein F4703DRAFT_1939445 [Phycomyces blakesleeanus]|uniref:Uncharacterized protein n=1 Tax=Phycomyces blakesleeanus (strain ATCC 8743b / DSM 1359 / FGSC 10004 / NBRC 33097 / NRRL 1555) TaxID=763407 RepID=A0A163EH81_PHYB8|nr:hypothetical protein PHYBLDRAFT_62613 [Phycomyces blakesleeanus NRRL 1555(-)]OAD78630.1 hypothetical protein PHYBLDRAFT_62613 [Phycomyces blakesleeanus NRRL 1555(-)]|eukprot:XP_018296670.1 hypothetical protein PHYBLDRAFT_62613 [Phycomyces blakesleeanus NRRL 1555(-)]